MKLYFSIWVVLILFPYLGKGQQPCYEDPDSIYQTARGVYKNKEISEAILLFEKAASGFLCDESNLKKWLHSNVYISWYHERSGNSDAVIALLDTVLTHLWRQVRDTTETQYLARLYADYCRAFEQKGEYQKAFEIADKASRMFSYSPFPSEELTYKLHKRILHIKGMAAYRIGDFQLAVTLADSMIDYFSARSNFETASDRSLLANSSETELGKYDRAIEIATKALTWPIQNTLIQGKLHSNIGYTYFKSTQYEEAIKYAQEALKIHKKLLEQSGISEKRKKSIINSEFEIHNLLALAYEKNGNPGQAKFHLEQALAYIPNIYGTKNRVETLRTSVYLGKLFLHSFSDPDQALDAFQSGLICGISGFNSLNPAMNPPDSLIQNEEPFVIHALAGKASAWIVKFEEEQDSAYLSLSLSAFKQAFRLEEQLKTHYFFDQSKYISHEIYRDYYDQAVGTAHRMYTLSQHPKYLNDVFRFMEQSKAFVLREAIQRAYTGTIILTAETEKNNRSINYSLNDIQAQLALKGERVLMYFEGKHFIYILSLDGEEAESFAIQKPNDFQNSIHAFTELVEDDKKYDQMGGREYYTSFVSESAYLYELLLKPVMNQKRQAESEEKPLIIIPDGSLSKLSFDVLLPRSVPLDEHTLISSQFRKLPYLIKNHRLRYGYSVSTLLDLSEVRYAAEHTYVGFAPEYGKNDERYLNHVTVDLPPLVLTQEHAQGMADLMYGKAITGKNASIPNFSRFLVNTHILQLIMHGESNDSLDLNSWLAFSKDTSTHGGFLLASDIYQLGIHTNLLILHACQSGEGRVQTGEGKMSLARAFIAAGCPNIINSMWNADEETSITIMSDFLHFLKEGMPLDEALQQAKCQFIQQSKLFLPFYWSNYSLIGSNDVIITRPWFSMKNVGISILGVVLLALSIIGLRKILF